MVIRWSCFVVPSIVSSSTSNRLAITLLQRDNLLSFGEGGTPLSSSRGSSIPSPFYITFGDQHSKVVIVQYSGHESNFILK